MIITNRKTHTVQQGSQEWLSLRTGYPTASEAPAAQAVSTYLKRSELLRQKATGITPEHDAHTLARFAEGHRIEALARPLAEELLSEDLSPVTMTAVADDLPLLASMDGLSFDGVISWECKLWNESLAEQVRTNNLSANYTVQMDQQQLVSGAERTLFTCSDGTPERTVHCWYESSMEKKMAVVTHWRQFLQEVAAYDASAPQAQPVMAEPVESLPAVAVQLQGSLAVVSNLDKFGDALRGFIERMVAKPSTDQEFADAEAECKALKKAEDMLEAAESGALAQISDVELLRRTVADLRNLARTTRLAREKVVAAEKDSRRTALVLGAQQDLDAYIAALNQRLGANWLPRMAGGFAETIKGKKSLSNMQDAVAVALTNAKAEANGLAERLEANRQHLVQEGTDWIGLFADFPTVGTKPAEDFQALAAMRIGQHKQAEAKRLEAERERIRAEEEAKAKREAEARAQAEAAEQARQLEAERQRIRAEEQAKAQAEAAAQRQQVQQQAQQDQADIANAWHDGTLAAPLAADLSGLAAEQAATGVASIDARQAISTARASAAVAPAVADDGPTMTMGQINARLKDADIPVTISAATLDALKLPYKLDRGVHVLEANFPKLCLALSLRLEKLGRECVAAAA
jgi:predicted phage-related endonuclease